MAKRPPDKVPPRRLVEVRPPSWTSTARITFLVVAVIVVVPTAMIFAVADVPELVLEWTVDYLKKNPDRVSDFLRRNPDLIVDFFESNPDLITDFIDGNHAALRRYIRKHPRPVRAFLRANPGLLD